jgi:predicted XRE-type DNA-binding protein
MHVEESSGNVFADLGLPDADERLVKAMLAIEIGHIITARKLTQQAAATLMGIDQPKVSHVLSGRLAGYSTERLMGFLTALGRDIEIVVRPGLLANSHPGHRARLMINGWLLHGGRHQQEGEGRDQYPNNS